MIGVLNTISQKFNAYVIVGSYALYLQKLLPSFSGKDIDIVVNVSQDHLSNERDVKTLSPTRFTEYGWVFKVNDMWVEAFNKQLPEYDIIEVEGMRVKVKSKSAIKQFYSDLDVNLIGGHSAFKDKMVQRKYIVTT